MIYKKFQHIEKLLMPNNQLPDEDIQMETKGLLDGKVYVFPKLDGTNCCAYLDSEGNVCFGGRKQAITKENDDKEYIKNLSKYEKNLKELLLELPKNTVVYGEFLIPHTIRSYDKDAWRKFYIFDIVTYDDDISIDILLNNEKSRRCEHYMSYDNYQPLLEKYNLDYIPVLATLINPKLEDLLKLIDENHFLIKDRIGEGIVVKNYNYKNPYGRRTWGKIVASDFHKTKNEISTFNKEAKEEDLWTHKIVNKYLTPEFIQKEFIKFEENNGKFTMKSFSELLKYIKEEFLKDNIVAMSYEFKQGSLNFRNLNKELGNAMKIVLNLK